MGYVPVATTGLVTDCPCLRARVRALLASRVQLGQRTPQLPSVRLAVIVSLLLQYVHRAPQACMETLKVLSILYARAAVLAGISVQTAPQIQRR